MKQRLFNGFIANDEIAIQCATRQLPYSPRMESDPSYWGYAALRAIALSDETLMQQVQEGWPHPPTSRKVSLDDRCLHAILLNHSSEFAKAFEKVLEQERQEFRMFGICLTAHGLYHAAQRRNPGLVADFNVPSDFPWDAGYHAACIDTSDPLSDWQFTEVPSELREYL